MSAAALIEIEPSDTIEGAAARIAVEADAVILLLGTFDASLTARVRSVCARAIAPVALLAKALIVDDGASGGLAVEMGDAARQMDKAPALLGLLDPGGSEIDSGDHSQLLRLPGAWQDASKARVQLLAAFAGQREGSARPVMVVLFGGSDADTMTVLRCARRGWPILVVAGAGRLGDRILEALANLSHQAEGKPGNADPDLDEIVSAATICALPLDGDVDDLKRVLLGPLRQTAEVLVDAWSRYDDLDLAANDKQKLYYRIQFAGLALAVFATLEAVEISRNDLAKIWPHSHQVLHILLILVPIAISVLAGFNSRFREGNKWILLRAAAESIKREIFRYRARAGAYSEEQCTQTSAQSKLAASLKEITSNLAQSEVNRSSLPHRAVEDASRLTFMTPEDFLRERLGDQQGYFVRKTASLYKRLRRMQLLILLAGGLGTFLAAIGFDVWVALTTALATAFTTKLEIDQVETSLVQYNVALTNLNNIRSWWTALTPWEKTRRRNIDLLVDQTEKTLERETAGWVQQMQSALDKLTEKQGPVGQKGA